MGEIKIQDASKSARRGGGQKKKAGRSQSASDEPGNAEARDVETDGKAEDALSAKEGEANEADLPEDEKTYKEQLQRLAADFENYRKRIEKENVERFDFGMRALAESLLPVLDNLSLALDAARENRNMDGLLKGIEMVQRMFVEALAQNEIRSIDVSDGRFDPRRHEALFAEETDEVAPDTILQEVQRGYTHKDRLLRPTKVKIAVEPKAKGEEEES